MLRSAGIVAAIAVLSLAGASDASAAARAYGGTTTSIWPVLMNTSADGKKVTKVGAYWNALCDSGASYQYGHIAGGRSIKSAKVTRGKFSVSTRQRKALGNGLTGVVTETVKGSISKTGATGRWHGHVVMKDSSGKTRDACDTGDVRFALFRNSLIYVGQTAAPQAQPLIVRLDQARQKVTGFWTSYIAPCEGTDPIFESVDLFDIKISDTGTVDDVTTSDTRKWTTKGTIGRKTSTGTLAFETQDQCNMGPVSWSVTSG
jgi:hypothetical protein